MNYDFEKEVARNCDLGHPLFRDKSLVSRLLRKTEQLRVPMKDGRGNVQPETLLQFIARTMLSPHDLEQLTVPELASRIAQRSQQRTVERRCDLRPKDLQHPQDDYSDPDIKELLTKVGKFMKPGELLLEFVARTGIGPHQIRTSSEAELEKAVALSVAAAAKDGIKKPQVTTPPGYTNPSVVADKYLPQHDPTTGALKFIPVNDGDGSAQYEQYVPTSI
jgi:hypothetical protein